MNHGGANIGANHLAVRGHHKFHDDGGPVHVRAKRGQVCRKLFRQHRKNRPARINRSCIRFGVLVRGRASLDRGIDIRDSHQHANLAIRQLLRPLDLVKIARLGVIDGRPKQSAQIATGVRSGGASWSRWRGFDGIDLGHDLGRKIRLEPAADHLRPGLAMEIE